MRTLTSMGTRGTADYRARRRERERQRRQQQEHAAARQESARVPTPATAAGPGSARRVAATNCGWCNGPITPRASGPIPKWCSDTCRKRAWEQKRAAASGRSAAEVIERVVAVPIQQPSPLPRQLAWANLLRVLARQLDSGDVYDRHMLAIAAAAQDVPHGRAAAKPGSGTRRERHPAEMAAFAEVTMEVTYPRERSWLCHPNAAGSNRTTSAPLEDDRPHPSSSEEMS
jgi:hypothetical protein